MDAVLYEVFQEEKLALQNHLPRGLNVRMTPRTIQEEGNTIPPAGLICIRTQSVIPEDWAKDIRGVLSRSTGYDHLAAWRQQTKTAIPLGYLPLYCARAVAEHSIMIGFVLMRNLKRQLRQMLVFDRDGLTGCEMQAARLFVIGVGHIGTEVVRIGRALGMDIRGFDKTKRFDDLPYVSLEDGLRWAELAVCALSLNAQTHRMLDKKTLASARKGIVLVNVARGEITPLEDMRSLLDAGILGGLGLDVYEQEGLLAGALQGGGPSDGVSCEVVRDLARRDNVCLTPHNAFNTRQALERKVEQTCRALIMFKEKKTFPFLIPEKG